MDRNDKRNISGGLIPPGTHEDTIIMGRGEQFDWSLENLMPTQYVYLGANDLLSVHVTGVNSFGLVLCYRYQRPDGEIVTGEENFTSPQQSAATFTFRIAPCLLLGVALVSNNAALSQGGVYANIGIMRFSGASQVLTQSLISGYVQFSVPLYWPGDADLQPGADPGSLQQLTIGNPAAGADWTTTFNAFTRNQILSIRAQFATAVAVANRQVQIVFDNSTNIHFASLPSPVQVASLTWNYDFAHCAIVPTQILTEVNVHIPPELLVNGTWRVRSLTTNIQAADQWSNIFMSLKQWAVMP